ncbi:membrane protein [Vibrio galatheae]|uniref:Membrane protein n=1 Tax=Vibrio galatheae TaxID=579748 RepID=A0A0F4NEU6_9VIBR|nr:membrane protein [Vibrio galatheae]KJY81630.1 membrane protein [Vibrio galatheae]
MKALQNPVVVLTLLALQACSTSNDVSSSQAVANASLDKPDTVKVPTFIMRGEVVLGHEVRSITPCGSQQQYWLDLSDDKFQQALTLVRSPYAPLYGEVVGHLTTGQTDGFVSDYSARFVVESVNILSAENPKRCNQAAKPTTAFGNEPSWSVSFANNQLIFQTPGNEQQSLALTSSRIEPDRRRYQFERGSLELKQNSCVDGMSDSLYGWSATLNLDDTRYKGCATLSNQDATQSWVGEYRASSTKSSNFSVTLKVFPDHSAITRYGYSTGESDSVESGFWQQLNPNQIQVVMTHHQQQPLLSQRIFTRDGKQLSANQEKVGNLIYPIADGGLTLFKSEPSAEKAGEQSTPQAILSSAEFNPQVDKAIRSYLKSVNTDPTGTRYRWLAYDLNGDGNKELLVQLDWCGSGGCTLLIFENVQQQWHFNSRVTQVRTPINLGLQHSNGWHDLVFFVSGGGAVPNQHVLRYQGDRYPLNPSTAPVADYDQISPIQLFSDGQTPQQRGVTL